MMLISRYSELCSLKMEREIGENKTGKGSILQYKQ